MRPRVVDEPEVRRQVAARLLGLLECAGVARIRGRRDRPLPDWLRRLAPGGPARRAFSSPSKACIDHGVLCIFIEPVIAE